MSFPSQHLMSVVLSNQRDPAADDVLALWRVPQGCEIVTAYAWTQNAVGASTANYFTIQLRDGGAAGAGTDEIGAAIGGTAGWAALTPKAWTIATAYKNVDAGNLVTIAYDETGTGTYADLVVQIDYKIGT